MCVKEVRVCVHGSKSVCERVCVHDTSAHKTHAQVHPQVPVYVRVHDKLCKLVAVCVYMTEERENVCVRERKCERVDVLCGFWFCFLYVKHFMLNFIVWIML